MPGWARSLRDRLEAGQERLVTEGRAALDSGRSRLASVRARLGGGSPTGAAAGGRAALSGGRTVNGAGSPVRADTPLGAGSPLDGDWIDGPLSAADVHDRLAAEGELDRRGVPAPARPPAPRMTSPSGLRTALSVVSLMSVAVVPGAAMVAGAITVAADAYCTYGSFCLYSGPNFDGEKVEYSREQMFCQYDLPPLNVQSVLPQGARSVVNNTRTASSGLGVKIYSATGNLVLTTVSPGAEVSDLDGETAKAMQTLCAYPKK